MIIRDRSGFTLDKPIHEKVGPEEPILRLERCSDVTIATNITGTGLAGVGLHLIDCNNVRVRVVFRFMKRGIVAERVSGLHVTRSLFQSIKSEGVNLFEVDRAEIVGSAFLDFRPEIDPVANLLDHPDAIWISTQAGRRPAGPSSDIRVAHNLIDAQCQGVFVASPTGARHRSIKVVRNTILSGLANAIYLQACDSSSATDNHVRGPKQMIRTIDCAPELRGNEAPEWMIGNKWSKDAPAGNARVPALD